VSLIEINKNPGKRDLRWFGVVVASFCGVVGALLQWKFAAPAAARVVWGVGIGIAALYYAVPPLRRVLYVGWMYAFWPLGWVFSHVILGVTYYLVITPIGLILRATGKDPMQRRFEREARSYWIPHEEATGGWFRQF
jgi:Saxitoxin biosynthesis operon protein SxtJ